MPIACARNSTRMARSNACRCRRTAATRRCCAPASDPFRVDGGLRVLRGNLGIAAIKISAVPADRLIVEAPAIVFDDQDRRAGCVRARRTRSRFRRGRAFPGAARERHARIAQADAGARRAAESRFPRRPGDRRAHVRCVRQDAGGDSRDAGSECGRLDRKDPRWRYRACRCECRHAGGKSGQCSLQAREPANGRISMRIIMASAANCSHCFARPSVQPIRAPACSETRHEHDRAASRQQLEAMLRLAPVVAVVVIDDSRDCRAAGACAGGRRHPAIEVTLRTPVALDAIRAIAAEVEGAIAGAGTVLTPEDLDAAERPAREFAVSPGATPILLDAAERIRRCHICPVQRRQARRCVCSNAAIDCRNSFRPNRPAARLSARAGSTVAGNPLLSDRRHGMRQCAEPSWLCRMWFASADRG